MDLGPNLVGFWMVWRSPCDAFGPHLGGCWHPAAKQLISHSTNHQPFNQTAKHSRHGGGDGRRQLDTCTFVRVPTPAAILDKTAICYLYLLSIYLPAYLSIHHPCVQVTSWGARRDSRSAGSISIGFCIASTLDMAASRPYLFIWP